MSTYNFNIKKSASRWGTNDTRNNQITQLKEWIKENVPTFFDYFSLYTTEATVYLESHNNSRNAPTYKRVKAKQWRCGVDQQVNSLELIELIEQDIKTTFAKKQAKNVRTNFLVNLNQIIENHPEVQIDSHNSAPDSKICLTSKKCKLTIYSDGSGEPTVFVSSYQNSIRQSEFKAFIEQTEKSFEYLLAAKADILNNKHHFFNNWKDWRPIKYFPLVYFIANHYLCETCYEWTRDFYIYIVWKQRIF